MSSNGRRTQSDLATSLGQGLGALVIFIASFFVLGFVIAAMIRLVEWWLSVLGS